MSAAIELDANQPFPSEHEPASSTGVFRSPGPSSQEESATELRVDMTSLVALPYRDARRQAIDSFEIEYVRALLERCGGNVTRCARVAGLDRVYLHRLLRKHGLRGSQPPAPPSEPVPAQADSDDSKE